MTGDIQKKEDKRVQYTKMFLRDAILSLLTEKPIEKITTTELCQKAEINRNTFYSHYYSPRELLNSIEDELLKQILDSLGTKLNGESSVELVTDILRIALQKKELCRILLSSTGDNSFIQKLVPLIKPSVLNEWKSRGLNMTAKQMDLTFGFLLEGAISIARAWLVDNTPAPPEAVAALIARLSQSGINSYK